MRIGGEQERDCTFDQILTGDRLCLLLRSGFEREREREREEPTGGRVCRGSGLKRRERERNDVGMAAVKRRFARGYRNQGFISLFGLLPRSCCDPNPNFCA